MHVYSRVLCVVVLPTCCSFLLFLAIVYVLLWYSFVCCDRCVLCRYFFPIPVGNWIWETSNLYKTGKTWRGESPLVQLPCILVVCGLFFAVVIHHFNKLYTWLPTFTHCNMLPVVLLLNVYKNGFHQKPRQGLHFTGFYCPFNGLSPQLVHDWLCL